VITDVICEWRMRALPKQLRHDRSLGQNCGLKSIIILMMKRLFPPINMRPNHTQRNRKCLHLKNLVCAFPPRCCSAGCFHSNRRFWGTGPCSCSSSSRNVLLWSSGVAYMRSSNKRTTRACRTVLMGWGKSLRLWASLVVGNLFSTGYFWVFFLFGALASASTLEGLCVDEECKKGRWDRRHFRLLDDKCTIENCWCLFGRCQSLDQVRHLMK